MLALWIEESALLSASYVSLGRLWIFWTVQLLCAITLEQRLALYPSKQEPFSSGKDWVVNHLDHQRPV